MIMIEHVPSQWCKKDSSWSEMLDYMLVMQMKVISLQAANNVILETH